MKPSATQWEGRPLYSIHIGGVFASKSPAVVRTVLGSCISVCLRDPYSQVGGMNHFMLPAGNGEEASSARYGVHAMELLINECMQRGADRRLMEAKVFGGGHVLKIRETDGNVPQSNIRFATDFLTLESIPVVSKDIGGYSAREIYFFTDSGKILLKRLASTSRDAQPELERIEREEREQFRKSRIPVPPSDDSNITLF